jgi:hypothetical protein
MTNEITPPPELVLQWLEGGPEDGEFGISKHVATKPPAGALIRSWRRAVNISHAAPHGSLGSLKTYKRCVTFAAPSRRA